MDKIAAYEAKVRKYENEPIYGTMVLNAQYKPTEEKEECVSNSVAKLLSKEGNSGLEPGLLLGKVQCGKADTYENIIGLALDKGIDIAVIFTKGTKALTRQTLSRLNKDFRYFKETDLLNGPPVVKIFDIMEIRNSLNQARIRGSKIIIVCKKQDDNLASLIKLFEENEFLLEKKTILVDDVADFASRNYRVANGDNGERGVELAIISRQIDELRELLNAPYLQVTATPYSLYLQPGGDIDLLKGKALAFRPRFTELVPTHDKYIGGHQYFVESADEDSMYSHLYNEVPQKCMAVLGKKDLRYIKNATKSDNTFALTRALLGFLLGVAIRAIQSRELPKPERYRYKASAVIHVNYRRGQHKWQEDLVNSLLEDIKKYAKQKFEDSDRLGKLFNELYSDYHESYNKAAAKGQIDSKKIQFPDLEACLEEINQIFDKEECIVKIINSDKDVDAALDPDTCELRLDGSANIFIGGSILDRGVTIKNLISFFYGRDADSPQQDTVLQHSRMYGARPLEDMAVTRLHTTRKIYDMLVKMNEIDENLRESIRRGGAIGDLQFQFIGRDKRFRPCGDAKIRASDVLSIKGHQRVLPIGFQTRSPKEIEASVKKIDEIIAECPSAGLADPDFKLMTLDEALRILDLIEQTYEYDEADREYTSDMRRLEASLLYCVEQAAQSGRNKFYALVRTDRNANRLRPKVGGIAHSPDSAEGDTKPAKKVAIDVPVLMLFRENGNENIVEPSWADGRKVNIGWSGAPFYWPVLVTQENLKSALYVLDERDELAANFEPSSPLLNGLDPDLVLVKSYQEDIETAFGAPGTKYKQGEEKIYWQILKKNNARDYILKDDNGDLIPVSKESDTAFGVNTLNKGNFPFQPRPYEYLLLKHGSKHCLLKLTSPKAWDFRPILSFDDGNLIDPKTKKIIMRASDIITEHKTGKKRVERNKDVCVWEIGYKISEVIAAIDVYPKEKDTID